MGPEPQMSEAKPQLGLSVVAPQARCLVDLILSFLPSKTGITIPPLTWLCAAVWLLAMGQGSLSLGKELT